MELQTIPKFRGLNMNLREQIGGLIPLLHTEADEHNEELRDAIKIGGSNRAITANIKAAMTLRFISLLTNALDKSEG
jgi:hypothetical protein